MGLQEGIRVGWKKRGTWSSASHPSRQRRVQTMNLSELDQFSEGLSVINLLLDWDKTLGKWYSLNREALDRWSVSQPVGFHDVERLMKEIVPDLTQKLTELQKKKKKFQEQCKTTHEAINSPPPSTPAWKNPEAPKPKRKRPDKNKKEDLTVVEQVEVLLQGEQDVPS